MSKFDEVAAAELLDALDDMAHQHCYTKKDTLETDSGAITANAEALALLAKYKRFRIVSEFGRMVVGYWPENEVTNREKQP